MKCLCIKVGELLSWASHMEHTVNKFYKGLGMIECVFCFVLGSCLKYLFTQNVLYGNELYHNANKKEVNSIEVFKK